MKAWKAIIVLVIVSAAFVIPSTAFSRPSAFQATAQVSVTSGGTVKQIGPAFATTGERIEGVVSSSPQWKDLAGASISVQHDSIVVVDPSTLRIIIGEARGVFEIESADGGGTLKGSYRATITGVLTCLVSPLLPCAVDDSGVWNADSGTGEFEGFRASGTWRGHLEGASLPSLVGAVDLNGKLFEGK